MQLQNRLANIELQVEQKQRELEQQRQAGKFQNVPMEAFKPYKSSNMTTREDHSGFNINDEGVDGLNVAIRRSAVEL